MDSVSTVASGDAAIFAAGTEAIKRADRLKGMSALQAFLLGVYLTSFHGDSSF